jgi:TetR/AcrR family transcriptional repressor of nem operon
MGRVSQAQAQENRRRVVATAARLFRERGVAGVSVADVMGAAGLTHGGFYKQFASKEALVAEAVGQAFADRAAWLRGLGGAGEIKEVSAGTGGEGEIKEVSAGTGGKGEIEEASAGTGGAARQAFVEAYLSPAHRDDPGDGCPAAGLGLDVARDPAAGAARDVYADGIRGYARWLGHAGTAKAETAQTRTDQNSGTEEDGNPEKSSPDADGTPDKSTSPDDDLADADLAAVSQLVGAVVLARATAGTDLSDRILAAARAALIPR